MRNIRLASVPIGEESLAEAVRFLSCTFDKDWRNILIQGEKIEITGPDWITVELSSEYTRGVSLRQILVLAEDDVIFTLSGYNYPAPQEHERVARILSFIARELARASSSMGIFFTIFPVEDRRHYRLRGGLIEEFNTLEFDGETCMVQAYLRDDQGQLLVGTKKGLLRQPGPGEPYVPAFRVPDIRWLVSDPAGTLFLGTAELGVFGSRDGGKSWTRLLHLPVHEVRAFASDLAHGVMFLNTRHGIFASRNSGRSWQSVQRAPSSSVVTELVFDTRGRVLIAKDLGNTLYLRRV